MKLNSQESAVNTCEACGNDFSCGAATGNCWCFEINLGADVLVNLQNKFKNCLCPDCLKNKIELLLPDRPADENCS